MNRSFSKIRHIQEANLRLEKRLMSEQVTPPATTGTTAQPNTQYMGVGTKFCFYGACRVDIRVIDKTTTNLITSKGAEGEDVNQLYPQVIKLVQDDLTSKKITGVVLPTLEQLEDTSPKK
jgi:hypothetical protein